MAFRTISVELRADVAGFAAQMGAAGASVKQFGREANQMARTSHEAVQTVSKMGLVVGGAVAVGFVGAATVAARFEKQMSAVQAVSGATASEMERLSEAALAAGASTKLAGVSASEAAAAEAELVRAGVSVSDVVGGALMGSLSLANAGQLDFAKSAEIAAQAMNIFNLTGSDVGHVADVLAAAANKSTSDVAGLGDALRQGGLVAAQTGLSLEETVGALAAFSDQALIGSDAGTSLKTMLQRLTPQSDEAAGKMEELGFSAYDAQGNFIGLEGLAGELQSSFGGLDAEARNAALGVVFGSDAVRGATVLISEGAAGIAEYVDAVNDQGAAARMAATQVDNLAGDVEALGGAFETALIENGAKANGALRAIVQTTTDLVTGFSAMPDTVQTVGLGLAGVAASGAALVGAAGLMIPKITRATTALRGMGAAGTVAAASLGPLFAVGSVATVGVGLFAAAVGAAERQAQELVDTLTEDIDMKSIRSMTAGIDEIREKRAQLDEEWKGLGQDRGGFWGDLTRGARGAIEVMTPLTNSVEDNKAATEALDAAEGELIQRIEQLSSNSFELMASLGLTREEVEQLAERAGVDLAGAFHEVVPALQGAHYELQGGSAAAMEMNAATAILSTTVADATERADAFDDALDSLFSSQFSVEQATDALQGDMLELLESFEANAEGIAGNTATLDAHTKAGLANRDTVRSLVEGIHDLLAAEQRQGATSEELQAILDREREALRSVLTQLGFNVEEVDRYVGALDRVPIDIGTQVTVTGADAAASEIDKVLAKVRSLTQRAHTNINITGSGQLTLADGGVLPGDARIQPPGTLVQWAEPETGGEAFIPMAPAKRGRSTSILAEVAQAFGFGLMPMANGGVTINLAANMDGLTIASALRGSTTGLDPEFLRRFRAYSAEVGPLSITSGFRSYAQQAALYARYLAGTGNLAAPPGRSKHERGLAIDHGPRSTPAMRTVARRHRLHYPVPGEPWHVEPFANGGIRSFASGGILDSSVSDVRFGGALMGAGIARATSAGFSEGDLERVASWVDLALAVDQATADMLLAQGLLASEFVDASALIIDRTEATTRAIEDAAEAREEAYQRQVRTNTNAFEMGAMSEEEHLSNLVRREERALRVFGEFSDEHAAAWRARVDFERDILEESDRIAEDAARKAEERAERVARNIADFRNRVESRQDNMFELGLVDVDTHLKQLDTRMKGEVEFSDEWMGHHRQRQQVLDDIARQEEERQREAEERERERHDAIRSRIDEFVGWSDVSQRASVKWGNSASALTENISQQVEMFTDWMTELDAAKALGVSGSVIEMLGLDDGPEALGQLRQLTGASREELATLNQASQQRDQVFQNRAIREIGPAGQAPVVNVVNHISIDGRALDDSFVRVLKEASVAKAIAGSRG